MLHGDTETTERIIGEAMEGGEETEEEKATTDYTDSGITQMRRERRVRKEQRGVTNAKSGLSSE
jgi:hypothetical protein